MRNGCNTRKSVTRKLQLWKCYKMASIPAIARVMTVTGVLQFVTEVLHLQSSNSMGLLWICNTLKSITMGCYKIGVTA